MQGIEKIECNGELQALIIRRQYSNDGIEFFTGADSSQQLGYMNRPTGYIIPPRIRKPVDRLVTKSQNVLLVRSGRVKVDLYDNDTNYCESRILDAGDVILLAAGGHGFTILEQAEIIEIKQGPYTGEEDLIRFNHEF